MRFLPSTDKRKISCYGWLEHRLIILPLLALCEAMLREVDVICDGDPVPVHVQDAAPILALATNVFPNINWSVNKTRRPSTPLPHLEKINP